MPSSFNYVLLINSIEIIAENEMSRDGGKEN
nr:MAG TPA: hypothetical protein [Caudoviricetes sp.]